MCIYQVDFLPSRAKTTSRNVTRKVKDVMRRCSQKCNSKNFTSGYTYKVTTRERIIVQQNSKWCELRTHAHAREDVVSVEVKT